jgi:hypothetical protein
MKDKMEKKENSKDMERRINISRKTEKKKM